MVSLSLCKDGVFVLCCSRPDFRFPVPPSSVGDSHPDSYGTSSVLRRPQKGRLAALRDEPSKVRKENTNNSGTAKQICSVHEANHVQRGLGIGNKLLDFIGPVLPAHDQLPVFLIVSK